MPYIVCRCDKTKDECLSNDLLLDGYKLPSRNKSFIIGDMLVINIVIMNNRKYLKRKELEQMATHLQFLKKQASEQQMLFFYSKQNKMHDENKTSGKSR